ncbi:MAG: threonine ammonia-lyase IlvA [Chitinophagales bacterium]|nr:threonine ammonia-lyase IlvA [Chitinophagales bacterium]
MSKLVPTIEGIEDAALKLNGIIEPTPLQFNKNLSELYDANIYVKREDLQIVRSYKIRGAYNFICRLNKAQKKNGVICASAGNHAQGFAYSCYLLKIKGTVVMPMTTPKQKVSAVQRIGKEFITVELFGDTYDDAKSFADKMAQKNNATLVPPFNHALIMEGQGTVALEMLQQLGKKKVDAVVVPIGGGGLASGMMTYLEKYAPNTTIYGAEPLGAPAMYESIQKNKLIKLKHIDKFVDGAAVKEVGDLSFSLLKNKLKEVVLVPEGKVCTTILQLYNRDAIIAEPAGALSVAALDLIKDEIKGKTIVCVISGGNNDIERMPEIKEKSLLYEGLKHYFIIKFPQRSGALKQFVNKVLGPNDDITLFEYTKKNTKESGPALVGVELKNKEDYNGLVDRMKKYNVDFTNLNEDPILFNFLV